MTARTVCGCALAKAMTAAISLGVARRVAAEPGAQQDVEAEALCDLWHLRQALIDGIDPDAAGQAREDAQVGLDLLPRDDQRLVEGRLRALEGGVGDTRQGRCRGVDQGDRAAAPSPEAGAETDGDERGHRRRQGAPARRAIGG